MFCNPQAIIISWILGVKREDTSEQEQSMKILVTGSAGFVSYHLAQRLQEGAQAVHTDPGGPAALRRVV